MNDIIDILSGYLSQDRRRALARGEILPDRTHGTALFADISGFTPLTERLAEALGPRRGVEELSRHLNAVYDALIVQVERFGGNVIGFAGDATICWFDDERTSAQRAVACAFAMHQTMQEFADISLPDGTTTIAVKIALSSGSARRFAVGDPDNHLRDVLAGKIVDRMAVAEHLATRGEVVADFLTVESLNGHAHVVEWRIDHRHHDAQQFAVLGPVPETIAADFPSDVFDPLPAISLNHALLRPWLLPAVFNRLQGGQGEFLTELRPGVAVFAEFIGLDFEEDQAGHQLDAFVRRIQAILHRYDGVLIDLTVGDKGSYFHACFGALTAHEDDARRAVQAALEFQQIPLELPFLQRIQIGISRGTLRTGTYGGRTRRVYGVLGDDVNLAARLMEAAGPGETLISERVKLAVDRDFAYEPRGALVVKGKSEPVPTFAVTGIRHRNIRLLEPDYILPMVGRKAELALFAEKMQNVLEGKGQVIGIIADAGMGKSRLVTEIIHLAENQEFTGFGGACQSSGGNTPYLVWQPIWQAFFDLNPSLSGEEHIRQLEAKLKSYAPHRLEALPLLSAPLGIPIPENDFTQALDPQFRKLALEALLVDCLKGFIHPISNGNTPQQKQSKKLLLVLEDLHWIDPLSRDLLEEIARACASLPIFVVLAYRPLESHAQRPLELENHPAFTRITLTEMAADDLKSLIRTRLAYLFPVQGTPRGGPALDALMEQISERAQGNPFFAEELLNYLHDQELDPYDPDIAEKIELPNSLHRLILSRIDQLTEREKTTLKVASVIGRLFPVAWLHGYYPTLGTLDQIKGDLEELRHLDLTPLDTPEPDLTYLFKHIVTQEVTYESLPYDMRARLHEQLASFLERANTHTRVSLFDLLAYHYGRSENKDKQAEYFRKAGETAHAAYANDAAVDYYGRLLPLIRPEEQIEILLKRGAVHELMGNWDDAQTDYERALALAEHATPPAHAAIARCQQAIGVMCRWRGEYTLAMEWLEKARQGWFARDQQADLIQTLVQIGIIHWRKGEFPAARALLEDSLALARANNDIKGMAFAVNNLGNVAWRQGDDAAAQKFHEESLALRRQLGGKRGIAVALNNLGAIAHEQGAYEKARPLYEESLALAREMGDKQGISLSLDNLGMVAQEQGDHATARTLFQESLVLAWELGDKPGILSCLSNLGAVAQTRGEYLEAKHLHEQGLTLAREMGDKFNTRMILHHLGYIALQQADYPTAQTMFHESLALSQEIGDKRGTAHSLLGLAGIAARTGDSARAVSLIAAAETLRADINQAWEAAMRLLYESTLDTLRTQLEREPFDALWQTGATMSLEEVTALLMNKN